MREVRWEYLRPDEILAEMERCPAAYLPVGAVEWHGPHLPQGTDMILAHEISVRLARRIGGVVHPAIFCGTERERPPQMLRNLGFDESAWIVGMDFPGNTIASPYYPEEILALMVREAACRLIEQGYRLIVLVNGHGAENQIAVLKRLAAEFTARGQTKVIYVIVVPIEYDEAGNFYANTGHADLHETAQMMACCPGRVQLDVLPPRDQPLPNELAVVDGPTFSGNPTPDFTVRPEFDPRTATAQLGEEHLEESVRWLAGQVQEALAAIAN
jgi:creatinine amidohydrolase